jgi:hypothetical protein
MADHSSWQYGCRAGSHSRETRRQAGCCNSQRMRVLHHNNAIRNGQLRSINGMCKHAYGRHTHFMICNVAGRQPVQSKRQRHASFDWQQPGFEIVLTWRNSPVSFSVSTWMLGLTLSCSRQWGTAFTLRGIAIISIG